MTASLNPMSSPLSLQSSVSQPLIAFLQLGKALQSGDLPAAQEAYGMIQQKASADPAPPTGQKPASKSYPMAELKEALRTDSLAAVQQSVSPAPPTMGAYRATGAYPSGTTSAAPGPQSGLGGLLNHSV